MPNQPDFGPLEQMVGNSMPAEGGEQAAEGEMSDLEIAMGDFENPELPVEQRAEALKLIFELVP